MSVRIYEAKALKNLDGNVKCSLKLKEGSKESSLPRYTPSCEETNNPVWSDAVVTLETYGFDLNYTAILITVISGGENIGYAEIPVKKIMDNQEEYMGPKL